MQAGGCPLLICSTCYAPGVFNWPPSQHGARGSNAQTRRLVTAPSHKLRRGWARDEADCPVPLRLAEAAGFPVPRASGTCPSLGPPQALPSFLQCPRLGQFWVPGCPQAGVKPRSWHDLQCRLG